MRASPLRRLSLLGPVLLALGCDAVIAEIGLPAAGGGLPVTVFVQAGVDPADVRIALDGQDVTGLFAPTPRGLGAELALPSPGAHALEVYEPRFFALGQPLLGITATQAFDVPAPAPALVRFSPSPVAGRIPLTAWLKLEFAADVAPEALRGFGFALACAGQPLARVAYVTEGRSVLLDPSPSLVAPACRVVWRGAAGVVEQAFDVAPLATSTLATALYERGNPLSQAFAPFPDDWWTTPDAGTATGLRLDFAGPAFGDDRDLVIGGLAASLAPLDGWSPVGPIVLAFSHAVEPSLLPADERAARDPFAPVALMDVDPASPDYGARIPYTAEVRNDLAPDGSTDHTLLLFPSITLRPGGRYAVVVTKRLAAAGDAARPVGPSAFFTGATQSPGPSMSDAEQKVHDAVAPLLDALETAPAVPIQRQDVALLLRLSIRSTLRDASDLVAMKENALVAPPPALSVASITSSAQRKLIVRGTLALPSYLGDPDLGVITRGETGRPESAATEDVPFIMTLPTQALAGPVPIVIFQHGSPGSEVDVLGSNNEFLDDAGYALVGIQDAANRRYGADSALQTAAFLLHLIEFGHLPLTELQTHADLQALLRALQGIAAYDWLPNGAPDGRLELNPSKLLYRGISFGSHHSLGFLPFAPEVTAAVGVVGAGRFYENAIHQLDFFGVLPLVQQVLPDLRPVELLVGLAALQNDEDRQDPHLLAHHLYQDRLPIAGISPSAPPPSLLWLEGIGDHVVSNNATRAAARELGISQVSRVRRESPVLSQASSPLSGNIGPTRTAGHYQYEPSQTPSCVAVNQLEGHYCPQRATEARQQILRFFSTALSGAAPEIIDPLP